jgi:hypothetical protein
LFTYVSKSGAFAVVCTSDSSSDDVILQDSKSPGRCRSVVLPKAAFAFLEKCRRAEVGAWKATIGRSFEMKDRDTTVVMIDGRRDVVRSLAMVEVFEVDENFVVLCCDG